MHIIELAFLIHVSMFLEASDSTKVVVKVNGVAINARDVEFAASQQGIAPDERAQAEPKLIARLIERQLVRSFLASRKIEPVADELQFQIAKAEEVIRKRGDDPAKLLDKIGYTPQRLKSELGLTLAWQVYVRQTATQKQFQAYFDAHKRELDGTRLRASQIFLKLPQPANETDLAGKKEKLADVRKEIVAMKLTFADAAKKYSEAPTRDQGGDVGLFGFRGKLPPVVSQAAFAMKVDEISEPVVSPLGVHLIQVTEQHPGEFSLEDVRPVIAERLSQQFWNETVEQQRATAKIEWLNE